MLAGTKSVRESETEMPGTRVRHVELPAELRLRGFEKFNYYTYRASGFGEKGNLSEAVGALFKGNPGQINRIGRWDRDGKRRRRREAAGGGGRALVGSTGGQPETLLALPRPPINARKSHRIPAL
jgi:hypothetical protein